MNQDNIQSAQLAEHFFRKEYGKLVAVITKYLGTERVQSAEDIAQETLLKAVDTWQGGNIPENPEAWLFKTAKNLTINILKRRGHHHRYLASQGKSQLSLNEINFEKEIIEDEQLKMMFVCCHPKISEKVQITLILKILCGFSISEIASSFFTNSETISKRLVRGRKKLRDERIQFMLPSNIEARAESVLKAIYLLYTEGYSPYLKDQTLRTDLCFEAIRLNKLLLNSDHIENKHNFHALLALMYFNSSRFAARHDGPQESIEMRDQDRSKWNRDLITLGVKHLHLATAKGTLSKYLILAAISAHHCIAPNYEETKWSEILVLYNQLIHVENSPIVHLNRSIALAKVYGNDAAIESLRLLDSKSDIGKLYLFHSTLGEFYGQSGKVEEARKHLKNAIALAQNERDIRLLTKKLRVYVPD